ncbi:MAG: thymidylate synthase [Lachnospiraceae bacterium]|nr:thymidylate synthase [Lachnospiraceae bacterium]
MKINITVAFIDILQKIMRNGTRIVTRGNEQTEILSQLLEITHPKERVLVLKHRRNNIFSLIAETMWVLGGRDDMAFLSRYLPRATEFSDDGIVWRAAYGPRLRNWKGIDQFKEVARLINEDCNTKRAAMVIFDPERDYIETKDVPCNNWLHFMERDGKLHLDVAVRANDAVWGFGGINSFEWSVLQEMMSFWTSNEIGTLSWFVGTFHVYSRHYGTSERILDAYQNKTLYDFGIYSPVFSTPLNDFDNTLKKWFNVEKKMRTQADLSVFYEIQSFTDELLRNSLEMLYIYNRHLNQASQDEIAELIEQLPTNDFKISAIEFFSRIYQEDFLNLTGAEQDFFRFYWNEKTLVKV